MSQLTTIIIATLGGGTLGVVATALFGWLSNRHSINHADWVAFSEKMQQRLNVLTALVTTQGDDLVALRGKLAQAEADLKITQADLRATQKRLAETANELDATIEALRITREERDAMVKRSERLERRVGEVSRENRALKERLDAYCAGTGYEGISAHGGEA